MRLKLIVGVGHFFGDAGKKDVKKEGVAAVEAEETEDDVRLRELLARDEALYARGGDCKPAPLTRGAPESI